MRSVKKIGYHRAKSATIKRIEQLTKRSKMILKRDFTQNQDIVNYLNHFLKIPQKPKRLSNATYHQVRSLAEIYNRKYRVIAKSLRFMKDKIGTTISEGQQVINVDMELYGKLFKYCENTKKPLPQELEAIYNIVKQMDRGRDGDSMGMVRDF